MIKLKTNQTERADDENSSFELTAATAIVHGGNLHPFAKDSTRSEKGPKKLKENHHIVTLLVSLFPCQDSSRKTTPCTPQPFCFIMTCYRVTR